MTYTLLVIMSSQPQIVTGLIKTGGDGLRLSFVWIVTHFELRVILPWSSCWIACSFILLELLPKIRNWFVSVHKFCAQISYFFLILKCRVFCCCCAFVVLLLNKPNLRRSFDLSVILSSGRKEGKQCHNLYI